MIAIVMHDFQHGSNSYIQTLSVTNNEMFAIDVCDLDLTFRMRHGQI